MTKELRSCPFCGGEAKVKEEKGHWKIRCKNIDCDVRPTTSWFTVKEDAIDRWNRRKPLEDIVQQLEESKSKDGLPADIVWNNALRVAIEIVEEG